MRAVVITAHGGPEVLRVSDVEPVPPGVGEVQVRMDTAGVGGYDRSLRNGWWRPPAQGFPIILGLQGSGIVAAVGPGVTGRTVGDRVFVLAVPLRHGGTWAELCTVPTHCTAPVPVGFPRLAAGAFPVPALAAHEALVNILAVEPGQTLLLAGAAGSFGTVAVPLAVHLGAHVIATGSPTSAGHLHRLGAAYVVDHSRQDWPQQVRALAPGGVDRTVAIQWGTASASITATRAGGRVALVAVDRPAPERGIRVQQVGTVLRPLVPDGRDADRLVDLAGTAIREEFSLPVDSTYPLDAAADAIAREEARHPRGTIVLDVTASDAAPVAEECRHRSQDCARAGAPTPPSPAHPLETP